MGSRIESVNLISVTNFKFKPYDFSVEPLLIFFPSSNGGK